MNRLLKELENLKGEKNPKESKEPSSGTTGRQRGFTDHYLNIAGLSGSRRSSSSSRPGLQRATRAAVFFCQPFL